MNKKLEKMIPYAFEAVEKAHLVKNGAISKQYNGYISSFGASVVQSGMLLALIFNHRETERSEKDKKKLMDAIYYIVKEVRNDKSTPHKNLLVYFRNASEKKRLKNQTLDAATAIKLVIRTFKLTDDGNH